MLRVVVVRSSGAAKSYYRTSDYYAEGQELVGEWGGSGAARLGLGGVVEREAFERLCDNCDPRDGRRLTPRTNQERRVAFDLNWHAPKSLSVLYGLTRSDELLAAFRRAVDETMREVEALAQARIRDKGESGVRTTGNLVWASYVHTTARPVGGIPDPHLHSHAVVFNTTFDAAEGRWKALDIWRAKVSAPYFEAAFHARLAGELAALGFDVVRTAKGWEIAGVPRRLLSTFSRRTELIERVAAEKGVTSAKEKDALGAKTRERKRPTLSMEDLRAEWASWLTSDERQALARVAGKEVDRPAPNPDANREAVEFAVSHCFERESVVPLDRLLAVALRFGVGEVTVAGISGEIRRLGLLVRETDGREYVTSREILLEERKLLAFAREGRGTCRPLGDADHPVSREWLSPEQRAAVAHVLGSQDRVVLVRGAAGVGKTALMSEAVESIERAGTRVVTLAPSAEASRGVLRAEGFDLADTVARFLIDERFQDSARGQVLWVDEAGLLGTRTLAALFEAAKRLGCRVVLVGDTRQHAAVERGAALGLLEREAGLPTVSVTGIRRQKGAYREAVQRLADGDTLEGFDRLDRLGWIREVSGDERERMIAAEYLKSIREGKSVLAVSPTHHEGERVTEAIRSALESSGLLRGDAREFTRLVATDMTAAERRDLARYEPGFVIQFHQNAPGFRSASRWEVVKVGRGALVVQDDRGQKAVMPVHLAERFQVFRRATVMIMVGDRIRMTRNGRSKGGDRKLENGSLHTVRGFTTTGDIQLENGAVVESDFGHLAHGYCVTSHASQGKTVDRVLVAQGAGSFAASSREQFYVSVSRGREMALVFTDDKEGLRRAVSRETPKRTATDLFRPAAESWRVWLWRRTVWAARLLTGQRERTERGRAVGR